MEIKSEWGSDSCNSLHPQDAFHERVKTFQTWQHAQITLAKKREAKAKAELAGRMDKVQQAQEEVTEVSHSLLTSQIKSDNKERLQGRTMVGFSY